MPIDFYKFAETLDKWMTKNNIDVTSLANKTNIASAYISNLLKSVRTPSKEKIKILAEILGAPLSEFYQAAGYSLDDIEKDNPVSVPLQTLTKKGESYPATEQEESLPKRDKTLVTFFPTYDLPVEFIPLCEEYRTLSPEQRDAWLNCAVTLMKEIKKL